MSTNLCIGTMVLTLLSATMAVADQAADKPEAETDKGRVAVQMKKRVAIGPGRQVEIQAGPNKLIADSLDFTFPGTPIKLGDYWLGLECYPADDAMRAQLKLPEGHGLVVGSVVPESPAAEVEIKRHDVLVKAGDESLGGIQDLVDAVESAKESELTIELIRGGKKKEITVTPAKRPHDARPGHGVHTLPQAGWDRARKLLERLQPGNLPKGQYRFRFFHPGMVLPPGHDVDKPLPGNMSISVTKQGEKPAKIVVERGDERWELTEDDLDKLPEDVRPHVERMLGRLPKGTHTGFQGHGFDFVPDWNDMFEGKPRLDEHSPSNDADSLRDRVEEGLKKNMDELNRQMKKANDEAKRQIEELRKSLDELREQRR